MAQKPIIYVSSTFVDLERHRAALKSALEKAQYDVECMEKYPAFDNRPVDKCLADVARADAYVLIVAHRYGFRPKDGNPERKSITELEYEEAGRNKGKPRLVFTVDPDCDWKPTWIDKGEDASDLERFRAVVEDRHGVNRFFDPDQLAGLVLAALRACELEKGLGARETTAASASNWPRPWDYSGYLSDKRRGFVGREWLFDEVRAWHGDPHASQALLICADFGVGKSAFMAELASGTHGIPVIAYHFCHHDTIETLNPATFVRSVAAQLAASLPEYKVVVEEDPEARRWLDDAQLDPASAFERAVVSPLNTINPPKAPCVLLVDALDEALDFEITSGSARATTIVRLFATRAARLPGWLRVLATSRRRQEVLQPIQQAFRCRTLDGEDVRNLDDILAYVAERCASGELSRLLAGAGMRASDVAAFLSGRKQSGGKFLYAVRVLNDVESGALRLDRLENLPPGMDAFYLDAFERRFPEDEDYAPTRKLLGVLCVKREPIARSELAAILRAGEEEVRGSLQRLEDFLNVRAKRYALDHLSLAQWLVEENDDGFPRAGRFAVETRHAENLLADWARGAIAVDRAHQSQYLARHLGAHLGAEERKAAFAKLLLDFRWLEARLRAAGVNALLEDWAEVESTPALEAVERALRHGAHVLGHDGDGWQGTDFLASQMLGRLLHRSEPEVRSLCAQATEQLEHAGGLRPLTPSLQSAETLLRTLEGHMDSVSALALLNDGRLASGSSDATIKLWNPANGACEATLEGHANSVTALALLDDGRLASGSTDHTIKLWNPTSGVCEATLEGHADVVYALAVLADGRLVSGSSDKTIKLWNPASGVCEATLEGHTDEVDALAVLADGRLASGSSDHTIKLWNPTSGVCEATLEGHTHVVDALAVLADGRLASASWDNTIKLWNPANGACEATLEGHANSVTALALLDDGRLALGSWDNTIKLWNPASGACEATVEGHADVVYALAVLADGRLVSGSSDKTIKLWNPASGVREATVEGHTDEVDALAVLADGRLASASADSTIKLWNPVSGVCEATLEGHEGEVYALAVLADGRLASGSWDKTIKLWNPASGVCEATLNGHQGSVNALAVLADGRLASGSWDNTIKLWNPASGLCEVTLEGHAYSVSALAVLADGRLASGSWDTTIKLWNPASGACEATLEGHAFSVSALAVLADGRLASGSSDRTIKLWNLASGACEATLEGHANVVNALAVLADGRLASGSLDNTIRIWTAAGGRWTGSVQFVVDGEVTRLAFAPNAWVLAAGGTSGRLHFLKIEGPRLAGSGIQRR